MKSKLLILIMSSIGLNSCCNIVRLVPLNHDNDAAVKLMTTQTGTEIKELELWTRDEKSSLGADSNEAAKLRLTYSALIPKVDALASALQNDFKAGEKEPTAVSIQAAKALALAITNFKNENEPDKTVTTPDWTVILVKVFTPLAIDQIQKERGSCMIAERITLKLYQDL